MSKRSHRSGARLPRALQSTYDLGENDPGPIGHRQERLERILHDELQGFLRDEVADPDLDGLRVVAIELTPDGGLARVAYAVQARLADERRVEQASRAALARATGFLRSRLASQLDLKRLPKLAFAFVGVAPPEAGLEGGEPWPG